MKTLKPIIFLLAVSLSLSSFSNSIQDDHDYEIIRIGKNQDIKSLKEFFDNSSENGFSNLHIIVEEGDYFSEDEIFITGNNLIIEGEGKVNLYCKDEYASVAWVSGVNIIIRNFTMCHLNADNPDLAFTCSGRVLAFDMATNIIVDNCELNGCGVAGLHDNYGNENILVKNCYIHNNSVGAFTDMDGGIWMEEIDDHPVFRFENNRIENNGPERVPTIIEYKK